MKVIFVAGPYSSDTLGGIMENIRQIEVFAMKVSLLRVAVVIPNSLGRVVEKRPDLTYEKGLDYDFWLEAAIALLRKCDGMILAPGWDRSSGVEKELVVAEEEGLPVFKDCEELETWLKTQ